MLAMTSSEVFCTKKLVLTSKTQPISPFLALRRGVDSDYLV